MKKIQDDFYDSTLHFDNIIDLLNTARVMAQKVVDPIFTVEHCINKETITFFLLVEYTLFTCPLTIDGYGEYKITTDSFDKFLFLEFTEVDELFKSTVRQHKINNILQ